MKRIVFALIAAISVCFGMNAGSLNKNWTNYNFQGVWEVTSTDSDGSLDWLVRSAGLYPGESPVTRVEIALDGFGRGYFAYYSETVAKQCNILGRIFIPHPNDGCSDSLSLLLDQNGDCVIAGLMTLHVGACDNDPSDKDHISINPINGAMGSARATRTSQYYSGNGVASIPEPSVSVIFTVNGISVENAEGSEVTVYDLEGILHYRSDSYRGEDITLNKGTQYLVKVNSESLKIAY